jgi:hypothetical protein
METAKANGIVERVYLSRLKKYIKIKRNIQTKLSKFPLSIKNKKGNVKNVNNKVFVIESMNDSDFIKL